MLIINYFWLLKLFGANFHPGEQENKILEMPAVQVEEREEEVSNEILDDSESGPLLISKLEVNIKGGRLLY